MQHKCRSIATSLFLYVAPINKLMLMLTKGSKRINEPAKRIPYLSFKDFFNT